MRAMSFEVFKDNCKHFDDEIVAQCYHGGNETYRSRRIFGNPYDIRVCTARACPVWGKCKEVGKARGK